MAKSVIYFHKLSKNAYSCVKGSAQASGFDLKSAYDYTIEPHGKILVKTDLSIKLPDGCYGRIAPRSGLTLKYHIDISGGVLDGDYRGNVVVILFNHSSVNFNICGGDRIAQLICEQILEPELQETNSLHTTFRGEKGFGSTGGMNIETNNENKELLLEIDKFLGDN